MTTSVSPGNIRQFGKLVDQMAKDWEPEANKLKDSKELPTEHNYPEFGELQSSTTAKSNYDQNLAEWVTSGKALHDMLGGLADACEKIAKDYETAAERANASVETVKNLLGQEMSTQPGGQQPTAPPVNA